MADTVSLIIPWRTPDDGGWRIRLRDRVLDRFLDVLRPCELIVADDPDPRSFNRGRALREGVAIAKGSVLVLADADLLVPPAALATAIAAAPAAGYVVPFDRLAGLNPPSTNLVLDGGDPYTLASRRECVEFAWPRRSTGGCNVITRDHYDLAGGFDPRFHGWGFEDSAFDLAVSTLVGPGIWCDAQAVHLWHPTARDPETPEHAASLNLCRRYEAAHGNPDAMRALIDERP